MRHLRRWLLLAAVAVAALAGCGIGSFTLQGSLMLIDIRGHGCSPSPGYSDVRAGAAVTVYDSTGKIVATGALGEGDPEVGGCTYPIRVDDVPGGSDFYQIEVTHRGKVTVSSEDARNGNVALTLGNV